MQDFDVKDIKIIKKSGLAQGWEPEKIKIAVTKSATRANYELSDAEKENIVDFVLDRIKMSGKKEFPIEIIHNYVESALNMISPAVAKSYMDYRNYKQDFAQMLNGVYTKANTIMFRGDKENANADSALVSTKRCLIFNEFNKELYKKFFLTMEENQAVKDGYIYVHDMSARRDTMNCFSRDTCFVTCDGVHSFYNYSDGDEVIVLSHLGNWRRAVVKNYGYQKLQIVRFRESDNSLREVKCTENHRWILSDGTETTNLTIGDKLISSPKEIAGCVYDKTYKDGAIWVVEDIVKAEIDSKEQVWCLEVEEDHSFVLEGAIPTGNCCLFDVGNVLGGGFEMGNIWYNEPKTLDVAFDVIGDIVLSAASQQYGGFTLPEVDKLLAKYAKKSYDMYYGEAMKAAEERINNNASKMKNNLLEAGIDEPKAEELVLKFIEDEKKDSAIEIDNMAYNKVKREFEQGFQGWEYKFNTVASSRGDYPSNMQAA